MDIKTSSINLIATYKDSGKDVLLIGIKEAYRGKPQYERYLRQEFARGKSLDNANIFKYVAIKEVEGYGLCIETEWEDSRTLAEWLQEGHSADEKKRVIRQVAMAIGAMHSQGVVNGCLNLRNVFITRKGDDVKLLTVRLRYADSMNQPIDTLKYLAPEAKDGTVGLDARADVYSLGVMLKDMGFMAEYGSVIERCCRFGRNERFEDVDSFLESIDHHRYTPRESDELSGEAASLSTNKKMAVIIAVIVVLIGVAVALFVAQGNSDDTQTAVEQPEQTEQPADTTSSAASDMDSTAKTQPAEQAQGDDAGATTWDGDNAFLNDLVPQMKTDLDKIYNAGLDQATVRRKVSTYYKGLRRVLKKQGKTVDQLDAFDQAFSQYTQSKNQQ